MVNKTTCHKLESRGRSDVDNKAAVKIGNNSFVFRVANTAMMKALMHNFALGQDVQFAATLKNVFRQAARA